MPIPKNSYFAYLESHELVDPQGASKNQFTMDLCEEKDDSMLINRNKLKDIKTSDKGTYDLFSFIIYKKRVKKKIKKVKEESVVVIKDRVHGCDFKEPDIINRRIGKKESSFIVSLQEKDFESQSEDFEDIKDLGIKKEHSIQFLNDNSKEKRLGGIYKNISLEAFIKDSMKQERLNNIYQCSFCRKGFKREDYFNMHSKKCKKKEQKPKKNKKDNKVCQKTKDEC